MAKQIPPRPSDGKLREESAAVRHHCAMLEQTHKLYQAHASNSPDDPPGMRQALAGAFVIHARCLHWFFYADEEAHRDDILAEHYIPTWRTVRPERRLAEDELKRINTELAHLSINRMAMPPEGVGFDVPGIYEVLLPAVTVFWLNVGVELLRDDLRRDVEAMPAREAKYVRVQVLGAPQVASANTVIQQVSSETWLAHPKNGRPTNA
jgi:hypothetical protein